MELKDSYIKKQRRVNLENNFHFPSTLAKSTEKTWIWFYTNWFFSLISISSNYSKPNLNSFSFILKSCRIHANPLYIISRESFEDNEGTLFGPKITQDERMTGKKEKNWPRAVQVAEAAEAYTSWVRFGYLFKNTYLETQKSLD